MGLGLGLGNTIIGIGRNRLGSLRPCMDNLIFEGSEIIGGLYLDKDRLRANDAKLINSNCLRFNGIDNDIVLPHIPELDDARNSFHFIYESSNFESENLSSIFSQRDRTHNGVFANFSTGNIQLKIANSVSNQILMTFYIHDINEKLEIIYDGSMQADGVICKIDNQIITNRNIFYNNLTNFDISNAGIFTLNSITPIPISGPRQDFLNSCANRIFLSVNDNDIFDFSCAEGNNNKVYNRVDDSEHQINGTLTDIWSEKQDLVHNNIENGFDLWKNDLTDELLRVPYNVNNQSIKGENDIITGYTWQSSHPANPKIHNYAETQIDFTNDGANADIPILLNAWHPDNLSGLEGSQLFYNKDAKKNTKNHLIYSQEITGDCLDKTKKYTKWK